MCANECLVVMKALRLLQRANAKDQLQKLLKDEMCGILQTANHYFADNPIEARQDRVVARLEKMGLSHQDYRKVTLSQVKSATYLSNED